MWGTIIAPALGGIGLVTGIVLMILNYSTLTGSTVTWVNALPLLLPAAAVARRRHGRAPARARAVRRRPRPDHRHTDTADAAPAGPARASA